VDGGPWREAGILGPNVRGAWVRWCFRRDARPGGHEIGVRAVDEAGHVRPDTVGWNDLGYLHDGVVGHPVEVL
jgi:hypothetical protein